MELDITNIIDYNINLFLEQISKTYNLNKYKLFLIFKWNEIIKENIVINNNILYIVDENNQKFLKINKEWEIEII